MKNAEMDRMVSALTDHGFRLWENGNMRRMYINASQLGLECEYYKSGNIRSAVFNGKQISNSLARVLKLSKTYIDLSDMNVHSTNSMLLDAAKAILDNTEKRQFI